MMHCNRVLALLDLGHNCVGDAGVSAIQSHRQIKTLPWMDAGCAALADAIKGITTPSVSSLSLAGNGIGARGFAEIAAALVQR